METVSVSKILQLFNMLSKSEQLEIADQIEKQTFKERWQIMDKSLPDSDLSEEDIMQEVRAVRYGSKN
ncbi:MAG: hypothetical protein M3O71_02005 [Bacteroidota bacterium]|nr:hypothetical protein [Bacteroidota bacterium]